MEARAKSLNERFRTLISLLFGLAIGSALLSGESRWEMSPSIEENLILLACFMTGIGAFGIYYPSVIKKEQERPTSLFEDAYRNYCQSAPSFIPFLSRLKPPPATCSVTPATFMHNILAGL